MRHGLLIKQFQNVKLNDMVGKKIIQNHLGYLILSRPVEIRAKKLFVKPKQLISMND